MVEILTPKEVIERREQLLMPHVVELCKTCTSVLLERFDGIRPVYVDIPEETKYSIIELVMAEFRSKKWSIKHDNTNGVNALVFSPL